MKLHAFITAGLLLAGFGLQAQVKEDIKKTGTDVGDKTAHRTVVVKSAVVDSKYKDKEGMKGETIFIDHRSKYYYVDKKGHKMYVSKAYLRDKKH